MRMFSRVLVVALLLVAGLAAVGWVLHEERPIGAEGAEADELARRIEVAVRLADWEQTVAVRWHFPGRRHLWDRQRHLSHIRYQGGRQVWLDLTTRQGVVREDGEPLSAEDAAPHLQAAWEHWTNDQFWLNPFAYLFADGVRRSLVSTDDGSQALLMTFTNGGVTPGDAYLVHVDEQGLPVTWQMWVSIIPVGGLSVTWEEWMTLAGGARVAQAHRIGPVTLRLEEIEGGDLEELEPGDDPFEPLLSATREGAPHARRQDR